MKKNDISMNRRIKAYAGDIIKSDEFKRMMVQTHHLKTSLGKHSVSTAKMGLILCDFLKRHGISVDEEKVVKTALLHDLGMLGRDERYRNNFECGRFHPDNSAEEARRLWEDIDEESVAAIKSHMWPLSKTMPHTKEAVALCIADKMASMRDIIPGRRQSDKE